ncbi:MAG: phosphoenolpyruvate--protein phosphotransferase [Rhodospirillales bacterium]
MTLAASASRRFCGEPASGGLLAGTLVRAEVRGGALRESGDPAAEAEALRQAMDQAVAALSELMAASEGDAVEILAFQVALLEDEALSEAAFRAIGEGTAAEEAWQAALAPQIADFADAEDSYFQARSADLRDLSERVLAALRGEDAERPALPEGAILLAEDLTPSSFLAQDWQGRAIALEAGSASSHVAMLARARAVPLVLGLGAVPAETPCAALLDGETGELLLWPSADERRAFDGRQARYRQAERAAAEGLLEPAKTGDGEAVSLLLNVALPEELEGLDPAICDGIGLVRSEFLFHGRDGLPDEAEQYEAYARIMTWAAGRPVVVRTLDAGGDKPIPGLTEAGESNPFLGRRGLRLSLAHPAVFTQQLRALLRAAALGPLKIMLPMVAQPQEVEAARALLQEAAAALAVEGVPAVLPELGIMVEVPAAALTLDRFDIAFASIGSNDLVQYTLAVARDARGLGDLQDPCHPAVLRLIEEVVAVGRRRGLPVSLCGDAGGDPKVLPQLLATGLRAFSMAPPAVGRAKAAIAAWRAGA